MWVLSQALCENLACSPEPAGEFLPESFSGGVACVLWSRTHTPPESWQLDKTKDTLPPLFQFGPTRELSKESLGAVGSTLSRRVGRAKTSPPPEKRKGFRETKAGYFQKSSEYVARFDRNSCSWKTPPQLWGAVTLQPCSVKFAKWGSMRDGACWEHDTPLTVQERKHRTAATVGGVWPTATTKPDNPQVRGKGKTVGTKRGTTLLGALRNGGPVGKRKPGRPRRKETTKEFGFATNAASTSSTGAPITSENGSATIAANGHTPFTTKSKTGASIAAEAMWATPAAHEARLGYQKRKPGAKGIQESLSTEVIDAEGGRPKVGGQLNPKWAEWLMGWPLGWTSTEPMTPATFQGWSKAFEGGRNN